MIYHVFDPTGNITVLAEGNRDISAADALMKKVPDCEQVGFLTDGGLTLTMAGGEFCGNASMCAAALYGSRTGLREVKLNVSGAKEKVRVTVVPDTDGFCCTVQMPPVEKTQRTVLDFNEEKYDVFAVYMQGICHLVMRPGTEKSVAEAAARQWCALLESDAVGLMFFDEENKKLTPLVYVRKADTLFWESSCASGTSAVGEYLAKISNRDISEDILLPAGTLHVEATPDGTVLLTGTVKIKGSGILPE